MELWSTAVESASVASRQEEARVSKWCVYGAAGTGTVPWWIFNVTTGSVNYETL
jgi:hypothetical protein